MKSSASRLPHLTIFQHVVILSLGILVPQILLGSIVAWRYFGDQRVAVERAAVSLARERRGDLDRDLEGIIGSLQALTLSPSLDSGDMRGLYEQAQQIVRLRGASFALRNPDGQLIMNTVVPFGEPLPVTDDPDLLSTIAEILKTRRPATSNLFLGAVTKRATVMVGVPVIRNGDVIKIASINLDPIELGRPLVRDLPQEWVSSIVDRKLRVITRTVDPNRYVGRPATQAFREGIAVGNGSFHGGRTLEGVPVFTAYQKSEISGWYISYAVPEDTLDLPLKTLWRTLALLGGFAVVISIIAATLYGRIIERGLSYLAQSARTVGRSGFLQSPPSSIVEIDEVGAVLAQADGELKKNVEHQRTLLRELDHRVKNTLAIIQSLVTQSFRSSSSPKDFHEAITGRVMALARSHEVLSSANWEQPEMADVAHAILARSTSRVQFSGSRLRLQPRVVVALSQCLHELLTNSQRHGALRDPEGTASLTWAPCDAGTGFSLSWIEAGGRAPNIISDEGFGTKIIRISIERQLGGACSFSYGVHGFRFRAVVPLQSDLGPNAEFLETPAQENP